MFYRNVLKNENTCESGRGATKSEVRGMKIYVHQDKEGDILTTREK